MADQYAYPTSVELTTIGQDFLAALTRDDPAFQLFPIVETDSHLLEWEQRDNYRGLQQIRGLNGEPPRVVALGGKRYLMEPGVYGEFLPLDEAELTRRRQWGTFGTPIPVADMVAEKEEQLVAREIARMRQVIWTLLGTGTFTVLNAHGALVQAGTFPLQTYTATIPWSARQTVTPRSDYQAMQLLSRGHSVSLGRNARSFVNRVTANNLLGNTNAGDIGGRRAAAGSTLNSITGINTILADDDLPQIEVMDDGYYDDAGIFRLFIPDGKVVTIGARSTGETLGNYRMTRNANNPDAAPGPYSIVYESKVPPKKIDVHRGHNGGPVIFWPSAIVIGNV